MGIIPEPEGIEFTVISKPYTAEDAAIMSAFIKASKEKVATAEKRKAQRAAKKQVQET